MRSRLIIVTLLLLGLSTLTATVLAQSNTSAPIYQPDDATGSAVYIIQFDEPALASYEGGINNLAATSPSVTGERKLDPKTSRSLAYVNYLVSQQQSFLSQSESMLGRTLDVHFTYQHAYNGVAVVITPDEAAQLATLDGVHQLQREFNRELHTEYGPQWINAPSVWNGTIANTPAASQGEQRTIGIIDSGLNMDHPSFADIGGDGYDHTNPLGSGNYLGLCQTDPANFVCNDKLIGYYIFTGETTEDMNGHGTHTGSTAGGNHITASFYITDTNPFSYGPNISGVAPHANIIGYDGCVDTGGCPLSALTASINQTVADGIVDVINYSIGGGSSNPWVDADSQAFLGTFNAGIVPVTSAGNSGPGPSTIGSPADAPWMIAVGASTHNRVAEDDLVSMSGGNTAAPADMSGAGLGISYGPAPIVHASSAGDGQCLNPFPAGTWTNGEIVVCDRGSIARVAKGQNVAAGGASGFVLANLAANGESVSSDPHIIPGLQIGATDGDILRAWLADGGTNHMATISGTVFNTAAANGDIMAAFSSRGPNGAAANANVIKPDITAPGVSIFAAYRGPNPADTPGWIAEYNFVSGTSMASPHTAGSAALLVDLYPSWSPAQIRSVLMSTSDNTTMFKDDGVTPADPFDMGAGRVDLNGAGAALLLDETGANFTAANPNAGGDPKTLNIASMANTLCAGSCSWVRTVCNRYPTATDWTATVTVANGVTGVASPAAFSLNAGSCQAVTVTLNTNGVVNPSVWTFGQLDLIEDNGAAPDQHLPIAIIPVEALAVSMSSSNTSTSGSISWIVVAFAMMTILAAAALVSRRNNTVI